SACLDVEDRRALDAELCADPAGLDGKGDAWVTAEAKRIAYRLDPKSVVDRAAHAATERSVTIRPAPDTMTYVTAPLPAAHCRAPRGCRCMRRCAARPIPAAMAAPAAR